MAGNEKKMASFYPNSSAKNWFHTAAEVPLKYSFSAAGADECRVTHFSCDHVVPGDHILPTVIRKGDHFEMISCKGSILLKFLLAKLIIAVLEQLAWVSINIFIINPALS